MAHSKDYIDSIKKTSTLKLKELQKQASDYNSVYLHTETWSSACVSAGCLLQIVDAVLNGESQSGVAIVRPPGHHAEEDNACGFCIFNNVAIAAQYAVQFHHLKRYNSHFNFENDRELFSNTIICVLQKFNIKIYVLKSVNSGLGRASW